MMELGAAVCTPKNPRCQSCPVANFCGAKKAGLVEAIPARRKKRATEEVTLAAAVLLDAQGRTLLVKQDGRAGGHLFSKMWQFPAWKARGDAQGEVVKQLQRLQPGEKTEKNSTQRTQRSAESTERPRQLTALRTVRHAVTYRRVTIEPFLLRVPMVPEESEGLVLPLDSIQRVPVSSATRKIASAARDFLRQDQRFDQ
jgi:adenine-specific DNA glycosylase